MIVLRYLINEVLKAQIAVLLVLLAIFVSQQFVRVLADASDGDFPASLVLTLLGLNLPFLAVLVIPLSLFLGILLAHGRMYSENEMVIFHGVGISEWYITRVTLLIALANFVITLFLSLYVAPWAEEKQNQVLEYAQSEAGIAALTAGRFQTSPDGRAVLFVEKIGRDNSLSHVFVAQLAGKDETAATNVIVARGGSVVEGNSGEQRLQLFDGVRYQSNSADLDYQVTEFAGYQMQIKEQEIDERRRKLSALPLAQLMALDTPEASAEFHWRLAIPLAILLMTLIAVPMSKVNNRQGKFAKMLPAILLYLGYFGLMVAGRKALEDDVIPSFLGMWWIHASALIIGLALLSKERPWGSKLLTQFKRRKGAK